MDDSSFSRKLIRNSLADIKDTAVDEAESGEQALKLYLKNKYDCIFLDLLMPEMDGYSVLEELKKLKNKTPVIVLTSDVQETSKNRCMELGAAEYINKPLNKNKTFVAETARKYVRAADRA